MKKKILSMLVVVCMIIGLLPMVAFAADSVATETKLNWLGMGGANGVVDATARYYKTTDAGTLEAGTESVWNIKTQMVDGVAVVTLKGATIGTYDAEAKTYSYAGNAIAGHDSYPAAPVKFVIEDDSSIIASAKLIDGATSITSITIECKDDAVLTLQDHNGGIFTPGDMTLINANIEYSRTGVDYVNNQFISCNNLSVTGGNINMVGSVYSGGKYAIQCAGTATFDNTTFYCEQIRYGDGLLATGLTIKNSTVSFIGTASYSHICAVSNGEGTAEALIENSDVTISGGTNSFRILGNLTVKDSTLYARAVWEAAVNADGEILFENSDVSMDTIDKAALLGTTTLKGGSLVIASRNQRQLIAEVPTIEYEGEYYMLLGAEQVDGSDATAVTDLTPATEAKNWSYMKIAAKEANEWTTEPAIEGWTYGETAKTPVGAAAKGDVVFTYSDAEDGTFTATVPTNAGTYYMKAEVASGDIYVGLSKVVSFTIAKAAAPVAPTGLTSVVGKTLADVALPEGWAWVDATLSVGAAGTNTFKANYTGTNSESASNVDVTITVVAANTPDPSNPQTGDNTAVLTAIALFALTAMAAAIVVSKKVIVR